MSIVLQSSGGGSVTLQEPTTASNFTVTVPAVTGTMATSTTPSFTTTIGVGGATPAASGAGITFPSTQSASSDANTLDDYEEGTWTVVWTALTGTPSSTTGNYTKIGKIVYWIYATSGTLSGTANSTAFSLPITPSGAQRSTGGQATSAVSSQGTGIVYGTLFYTATFSTATEIIFSGFYQA
jgi:hypothetical protein